MSSQTLRRWDCEGILSARRHPLNNYRVYDEREVRGLLGRTDTPPRATTPPRLEPSPGPAVIGREAELRLLDALFDEGERLIVILGPAGVGKSALLDAWLNRRDGAVLSARVGAAQSAEELAQAIAAACGTVIRAPTNETMGEEVARAVSQHRGLALDEIENLGPEALALVVALVRVIPILVTTRVRPRLPGEHLIALAPLSVPTSMRPADVRSSPAVSLFVERMRRHGVLRELDDEGLSEAAAVVLRLEGLPLALELAAARASTIGLPRLRHELDRSLDALTTAGASTLSATVATSLARLGAAERDALAAASMLREGFELADLERLLATPVEGEVRTLIDHSMLIARQGEGSDVVLGVHATVRELALASIDAERRSELLERHALLRAEDASNWASDRSSRAFQLVMRFEEPMLRAFRWWSSHLAPALPRGGAHPEAPQRALDLARALGRLVEGFGPSPAIVEVLDRAIMLGREHQLDQGRRAELHIYRGFAFIAVSELDEAREQYEEALRLARAGRSPRCEALAHVQLAWLDARANRIEASLASVAEGLRVATDARDAFPEILLLSLRAQLDMRHRKLAPARRGFERARALAVRLGDLSNEASATGFLGIVAFDEGALVEAERLYRDAARLAASHPAPFLEAVFAGYRAIALHHLGDPSAAEAYESAIAIARRVRSERFETLFSQWYAALRIPTISLEEGRRALDAADRLSDPEARRICELHRGLLDLRAADEALAEGRVVDASRHESRACQRLGVEEQGGREVRVAAAFLERALRARAPVEGASIWVAFRGRSFGVAGACVNLRTRPVLGRILFHLALERMLEEGAQTDAETLIGAGWPSERIAKKPALHRLQVAISTLRQLGLRDALESSSEGYRLVGRVGIDWSR